MVALVSVPLRTSSCDNIAAYFALPHPGKRRPTYALFAAFGDFSMTVESQLAFPARARSERRSAWAYDVWTSTPVVAGHTHSRGERDRSDQALVSALGLFV
jgi:hypothetical protein